MHNLNTGFYKDLDTNFEQACELSEQDLTHDKIIQLLKEGNIPEKQIAALRLDDIYSQEEAEVLINNLTGCDGKIREAVALKITQILSKNHVKLDFLIYPQIFADATIDINANICRLVLDSVSILKTNPNFTKQYLEKILKFISEAFEALDSFIFRDKKYVINKQLFKLYWCLEALKLFAEEIEADKLLAILERACKEKEYTIREKVAQIVVNFNSEKFTHFKKLLAEDENYYVREVFKLNH